MLFRNLFNEWFLLVSTRILESFNDERDNNNLNICSPENKNKQFFLNTTLHGKGWKDTLVTRLQKRFKRNK